MLKLKVCGITDPKNLAEIALVKPDFMGFILYENSPRYVSDDFLKLYATDLPNVKTVLVSVNMDIETLLQITSEVKPYALQLHGKESVAYCHEINESFRNERRTKKERHGNLPYAPKLIKVFSVDAAFDFDTVLTYSNEVDFFLFDTKCKDYGGSGKQFQWELLCNYVGTTPFFLSGGIGPGDIETIRQIKHPQLAGIDINSRFESLDTPLLKNTKEVQQFKKLLQDV